MLKRENPNIAQKSPYDPFNLFHSFFFYAFFVSLVFIFNIAINSHFHKLVFEHFFFIAVSIVNNFSYWLFESSMVLNVICYNFYLFYAATNWLSKQNC